MANNCLVTRLKGVINNDQLPKFGELVIPMIENTTVDSLRWLEFTANEEFTVSTDGTGYFGNSSASEELTSCIVPANTTKRLFFNSGTYNVHVSNKYALTRISNGSSSTTSRTPMTVDIYEFKYCTNLIYIRLGMGYSYGDLSNLSKLINLTDVAIVNTNISGSFDNSLGNLINLKSMRLYGTNIQGTVEGFVAKQITSGRTTCTPGELECRGLLLRNGITFGGLSDNADTMEHLSWVDEDHIVLYIKNSSTSAAYNYSLVTKIYAKGATAEEISQWESDGKTVIVIE